MQNNTLKNLFEIKDKIAFLKKELSKYPDIMDNICRFYIDNSGTICIFVSNKVPVKYINEIYIDGGTHFNYWTASIKLSNLQLNINEKFCFIDNQVVKNYKNTFLKDLDSKLIKKSIIDSLNYYTGHIRNIECELTKKILLLK